MWYQYNAIITAAMVCFVARSSVFVNFYHAFYPAFCDLMSDVNYKKMACTRQAILG